jgi:hypothetical protein
MTKTRQLILNEITLRLTHNFHWCHLNFYLKHEYPVVSDDEYRFLNSGGFIGYASDVYSIITSTQIMDNDDDQLFYTKIFFNKELRVGWLAARTFFQYPMNMHFTCRFAIEHNQYETGHTS